ncbi:MAG: hypothetical protein HZA53_03255 [Planctomycetes bacterium]|nr:hypothetical protein [Planctomycetota bacterium]
MARTNTDRPGSSGELGLALVDAPLECAPLPASPHAWHAAPSRRASWSRFCSAFAASAFLGLALLAQSVLVARADAQTASPIGSTASALTIQAGTGCELAWTPTFGYTPYGTSISKLATYDAGNGLELYAGGDFTRFGALQGNYIARWNGTAWSSLGSGLDAQPTAMAVYDDGTGPALYVCGNFSVAGGIATSGIARWNGSSWSAVGSGLAAPSVLLVYDDGSGPALFAGGNFTSMGGVPANRVAKWNGTSWSALGTGANSTVRTLTRHDDGSGPALYAGGDFSNVGGVPAGRVARWNGTSWSALGPSFSNSVYALTSYDSGTGARLYAAGTMGLGVQRWNGTSWSYLGPSGLDGAAYSLAVFDDGAGAKLVATGVFTHAGSLATKAIAAWDGSAWSALGSGLNPGSTTGIGLALVTGDIASTGNKVYVAGTFDLAGNAAATRIAAWNGSVWSSPHAAGISGTVWALTAFDDGAGSKLYAGGSFLQAGGLVANHVAAWNGSTWSALGTGTNAQVDVLRGHDDGTGPALYAGGSFTAAGGVPAQGVARWTGTGWSALGPGGPVGSVIDLRSHDDGSGQALFVAAQDVLKWNGTSWSALNFSVNGTLRALEVFDDGTGPKLIAGGIFVGPGGLIRDWVGSWNGTSWTYLGSGMDTSIFCFGVFDDGGGSALYAGGDFNTAGGVFAPGIAKWNGTSWSPLGSGIGFVAVNALTVFDGPSGPVLHVGGYFTNAGGVPANYMATWNGTSWGALESGLSFWVADLAVYDDGSCLGPALYAGGEFQGSASGGDSFLARWGCVTPTANSPCSGPFCAGDGADPAVTTACPCANFGAPGHGCANSVNSAGAQLAASGILNPDAVVLVGSGMPASVSCIYLQGVGLDDAPFGDGVRCAGFPLLRLRTKQNAGGTSRFPDSTDTISLSQRGGVTPGSGVVRLYQTYYRNASASFCPPETFNVTNGWRITW